jgi:hypothetical protein
MIKAHGNPTEPIPGRGPDRWRDRRWPWGHVAAGTPCVHDIVTEYLILPPDGAHCAIAPSWPRRPGRARTSVFDQMEPVTGSDGTV